MLRVNDIYDADAKRLMTSTELRKRYNFGNFLMWEAVIMAMPKAWKEGLVNGKPMATTVRPTIYDTLNETTKIAKWSYTKLMKTSGVSHPVKAETKWEEELRGDQISWQSVFKSLHAITRDVKLKWLQLRTLHRILPTNRLLKMMGIKDYAMCERCSEPNEDIYHVFWGCIHSGNFWARLQQELSLMQAFTPKEIILGNVARQGEWTVAPLRMCVLLGKQFIWQCRWRGETPGIDSFSRYVSGYVSVEKCIAARSGENEKFNGVFSKLSEVLCR